MPRQRERLCKPSAPDERAAGAGRGLIRDGGGEGNGDVISSFIVEAALKSTLLIAGAAVLDLALRRRGSAAVRHMSWLLALAGLALLPLFAIALPPLEVPLPIATAAPAVDASIPTHPDQSVSPAGAPAFDDNASATTVSPMNVRSESVMRSTVPSVAALAVYLTGLCLVVGRLARQRWMVHQVAKTSVELRDGHWVNLLEQCADRIGVRPAVRLLRSRVEAVPMAFGIRVPTIVVPALADTWDEQRRRAVLLHELAHVARRDCLTQTLASVACAMYWFHPGVWWTARRLRDEGERACDDRVVAAGTRPTDYAQHLLRLAYSCGGKTPNTSARWPPKASKG